MENTVLTHDYFSLDGSPKDVNEADFLALLDHEDSLCSDVVYRPSTLSSPYDPGRFRANGITFRNVSFSQTKITDFEFTKCTFQKCLLISTIFQNCRFTSCRFIDCNPHRAEFKDCFVDPSSFVDCIPERQYSNIGVYIFQELLRNSRQQVQPDFADEAQYHFRRWQRFQLREELRVKRSTRVWLRMGLRFVGLFLFDVTTGSGMRLGRLAMSALILLLSISALNLACVDLFGLQGNNSSKPIGSLIDASYFSAIVMTTVGFGDITPATPLGRLVVGGEAILGLCLFALLTSTIYRKLSS